MSGMERRREDAALKVAQIKLDREECASDMEQSSTCATRRDARIMLSKEECV